MVLVETLKHHFQVLGVDADDETFLNKCLDLCDLYDVNAELFVEMWVAFMVERNSGLAPTLDTLGQLERSVLKKDNKNALKATTTKSERSSPSIVSSPLSNRNYAENEDILEIYGYKGSTTPTVKRNRSPDDSDSSIVQQNKIRALSTTFSPAGYARKTETPRRIRENQRGKILEKFGGEVADWKTSKRWEVKVGKTRDPHVPAQAMYMFELLEKKASNLQRVCREYGTRLISAWCKSVDDDVATEATPLTSNVKNQSQKPFRTWGRIVCEMNGKLNSTAIMLEGCKRPLNFKAPSMVALDLKSIDGYSLFPGQILAVEGTNPSGNELGVTKIFSSGYTEPSPAPRINDNLHFVVASGPFTDNDNFDYQPLFRLMEHVAEIEPHVLILVGPFVSSNHPDVQNATILETFQELFQQIVEKIMNHVEGKLTRVVMIPSHLDAHHDPLYPTPEFFLPKSMRRPNLHLMPDPCMLDVEGLTIGVTSVDIIRHLGGEEVYQNMTGMDRLGRLANHVLSQGCFYPLYPPSTEVNIDTTLWEKYAFMYQQPHVLFLPSDMRHFCKWTHDCLVINPERLNKHSYARIIVKPSPDRSWTKSQVDCEILKI